MKPILSLHVLMLVDRILGSAMGKRAEEKTGRKEVQGRVMEGFSPIRLPVQDAAGCYLPAHPHPDSPRPYWPLNNHDTPSKPSNVAPLPVQLLICSMADTIDIYRVLQHAPHPLVPGTYSMCPSRCSQQAASTAGKSRQDSTSSLNSSKSSCRLQTPKFERKMRLLAHHPCT